METWAKTTDSPIDKIDRLGYTIFQIVRKGGENNKNWTASTVEK